MRVVIEHNFVDICATDLHNYHFSEWILIGIIPFSLENSIEILGIIEQFRSESIPKESVICALTRTREVSLRIL